MKKRSIILPALCLALGAISPVFAQEAAAPAAAPAPAGPKPVKLAFNAPSVFKNNFYVVSPAKFDVNPETGAVVGTGGQVARAAIYSPGGNAAPTSYRNGLDAFYNGSVATTFSMRNPFTLDSNAVQTIVRLQDSGYAVVGLTTIYVDNNGKVQFSFGVINVMDQTISYYFGAGGSNGQSKPWPGSGSLVPGGTPLKVVMQAKDMAFELSLQDADGNVLASSGWQEMKETLAAKFGFNKAGGVGFRTSWTMRPDNVYTILGFEISPAKQD